MLPTSPLEELDRSTKLPFAKTETTWATSGDWTTVWTRPPTWMAPVRGTPASFAATS
jgi:hypothetical protein